MEIDYGTQLIERQFGLLTELGMQIIRGLVPLACEHTDLSYDRLYLKLTAKSVLVAVRLTQNL